MRDVVARVLSRTGTALASTAAQHRQQADHYDNTNADEGALEREARAARRRVAGLSTELEDVSEVEYRQVRLERVVLVGLELPRPHGSATGAPGGSGLQVRDTQDADTSLRELAALAETAGSQVLDALIQRRDHPDPATYLGSGKARELADVVAAAGADTVIVDGELAPSQRRALEDVVGVKVVDRTALILDIFAQHAKSREGKAQVELAQLEYLLPRLRGWGESMSRQAGGRVAAGQGIGSRGPGETKIELDRRRIRQRMARLRREIQAMAPSRETKRGSRRRGAIPSVAIAGYTNAGKSSLMNRLTEAGIMVEDALFATLDPTVRRAETATAPGRPVRSAARVTASARSVLLRTMSSGTSRAPGISDRTVRTAATWLRGSGWAASTTCSTRSAPATSSRVERKASMSSWGRLRTKPTVSVRV